jgi:CTP synthase (UTP-ammonia lyase)
MTDPSIALAGDFDSTTVAHQAIPLALEQAATRSNCSVNWQWVATDGIESFAALEWRSQD